MVSPLAPFGVAMRAETPPAKVVTPKVSELCEPTRPLNDSQPELSVIGAASLMRSLIVGPATALSIRSSALLTVILEVFASVPPSCR